MHNGCRLSAVARRTMSRSNVYHVRLAGIDSLGLIGLSGIINRMVPVVNSVAIRPKCAVARSLHRAWNRKPFVSVKYARWMARLVVANVRQFDIGCQYAWIGGSECCQTDNDCRSAAQLGAICAPTCQNFKYNFNRPTLSIHSTLF